MIAPALALAAARRFLSGDGVKPVLAILIALLALGALYLFAVRGERSDDAANVSKGIAQGTVQERVAQQERILDNVEKAHAAATASDAGTDSERDQWLRDSANAGPAPRD